MRQLRWILFGAGILAGVPALCVLILLGKFWIDNWAYADRVFYGVVSYDRVVASQRYIDTLGIRNEGCIYAVVHLSPDASSEPPRVARGPNAEPHDPLHFFGKGWQSTPASEPADPLGNERWIVCQVALGEALFDQLRQVAATSGGWWTGNGGDLSVYSQPAGLAFKLREGD